MFKFYFREKFNNLCLIISRCLESQFPKTFEVNFKGNKKITNYFLLFPLVSKAKSSTFYFLLYLC